MASVAKPVSKSSKAVKKPTSSEKTRSHPPYVEMVKEAIVALKERTGSSQYAISKFIEEKHNQLPSNFKKLLLTQLKKFVASGKLIKVKNSFKLAAELKPTAVKKPKTETVKPKSEKVVKKVADKGKKVVSKTKAAVKPAATKVKKSAKTATITSPGKKAAAVKTKKVAATKKASAVKAKKVATKVVKKPKSIKTPVKKAPAKKKTTATKK
ncbi:histone H1-like [Impatiens glandulifera]|uniref:histone H1-like n=1 Tax=Impatiens glandulifera TaxID=253017 RepID=UPI001FB1061D|nr:histone H1-like [Impatiens glandulifera]